ncbi:molybdopterin-dependent oxidoreductase [Alicyclobacillus macrosporangiidus]|jgi:DMSO/TMAO reductase YedYZ molybdopterin-dependent catalytic subunit|uniref:Oxidoreductase molybdopterin binding domain-containing protein n=1 Tax=Alicyclobacillus macrosporangiidus TaxID=392015 RepID=A0A1I7F170_9BACL|nr:molybdopterin-dependent oxidoreductase [Alicyclobacillus macrosporangiidus]SFU29920.1 Oxidoreductase molybdopterin binding domain-containing protein [Alicyclobacillus macrosporangiidus]
MKWRFKSGKWPRWMIQLHTYTIISFVLLMLTGVALFAPRVHAMLIPYLPVIYDVHIVFGLVFGVTLLTPLLARLPAGKWIRRLDWFIPMVFGAIIVMTGILIWQVTRFPTTWRSRAFLWHGWMSYALSAWLLIHATYKAMGYRPARDGLNAGLDPTRRMFVKWLGTGVVGAVVLTIVDPVGLLRRSFTSGNNGAGTGGTSTDFAAYYTVTDGYPAADLKTYRLTLDGLVTHPTTLTWNDLVTLEAIQEQVDFHCVTGWSVPNVQWKGVHLKTLADLVKPSTTASYVHFYSFDGVYTESLSLSEALDPTVMLAYQLNGQPLRRQQGFPLRLVVPKMYGYKSIKWVNRVEFSDKPLTGYWEARGYPNEAYLGNPM